MGLRERLIAYEGRIADNSVERLLWFLLPPGEEVGIFDDRIGAAVNKMKRYSVLLSVSGDDDRWEISPVLALVVGADEVAAITDELQRLLHDQGLQGDQT